MNTLSHSLFTLFLPVLSSCALGGDVSPPEAGTEPTLILKPTMCFKPYVRPNKPIHEMGGGATAALEVARTYLGALNGSVEPVSLGGLSEGHAEACQLVTRTRRGWSRNFGEGALVAATREFGAKSVLVTLVGGKELCMADTVGSGEQQINLGTASCFDQTLSVSAAIVTADGTVAWKHGSGESRATPSHPPQDVHHIVAGAFKGVPLGTIVGSAQ